MQLELVSWSLTSLFSTNMAISETNHAVGNLFGILAYTDDITLKVPSAAAMHRLLQNAATGVASIFAARGRFHIGRL